MKMSINHKTSSTGLIPTYSHQQNIYSQTRFNWIKIRNSELTTWISIGFKWSQKKNVLSQTREEVCDHSPYYNIASPVDSAWKHFIEILD